MSAQINFHIIRLTVPKTTQTSISSRPKTYISHLFSTAENTAYLNTDYEAIDASRYTTISYYHITVHRTVGTSGTRADLWLRTVIIHQLVNVRPSVSHPRSLSLLPCHKSMGTCHCRGIKYFVDGCKKQQNVLRPPPLPPPLPRGLCSWCFLIKGNVLQ